LRHQKFPDPSGVDALLEGMIAAQLLAAHNAAMECYRRAMLHPASPIGLRFTAFRTQYQTI
jgi:hypothetical protein